MAAFELIVTISASIDMLASAERADHLSMPPLLGDEVAAAPLRIEMIYERNERIEVSEFKFHDLSYVLVFIYT